ncbi:MAG: GNAT family N-acetyltransferase [Cyanobacteria bacterium P01_F01_bin.33]
MASSHYAIATMSRSDLDLAVGWAAAEGWNPGLHDADSFYAADPTGFLMGVLDGRPIASISAVKYGQTYGFIGFYIVKPEYRGRGYGYQLWQAGLDSLAERAIGLDGVVEQQPNYVKSGFALAHRNIRYEGIADSDRAVSRTSQILPLKSLSIEEVIAYDRAFFPDNRVSFLKSWISQLESRAVGCVRDGKLAGYGVLRPCQTGYKIGPLFADTPDIAEAIFLKLKARIEAGKPFFLDVPQVNPDAVALAETHHMHGVFETARMYTQPQPDLSLGRTFGVTTFELG